MLFDSAWVSLLRSSLKAAWSLSVSRSEISCKMLTEKKRVTEPGTRRQRAKLLAFLLVCVLIVSGGIIGSAFALEVQVRFRDAIEALVTCARLRAVNQLILYLSMLGFGFTGWAVGRHLSIEIYMRMLDLPLEAAREQVEHDIFSTAHRNSPAKKKGRRTR